MGWFRHILAVGRKIQKALAFLLLLLSYLLVIGPYHYLFLLRRKDDSGSLWGPMARRGRWHEKKRSPCNPQSLRKPY